jgi:hypothetical protein
MTSRHCQIAGRELHNGKHGEMDIPAHPACWCRELDESDSEQGWCGLCGPRDAADMVPRLKGVGPDGAVVGCRHAVTG